MKHRDRLAISGKIIELFWSTAINYIKMCTAKMR